MIEQNRQTETGRPRQTSTRSTRWHIRPTLTSLALAGVLALTTACGNRVEGSYGRQSSSAAAPVAEPVATRPAPLIPETPEACTEGLLASPPNHESMTPSDRSELTKTLNLFVRPEFLNNTSCEEDSNRQSEFIVENYDFEGRVISFSEHTNPAIKHLTLNTRQNDRIQIFESSKDNKKTDTKIIIDPAKSETSSLIPQNQLISYAYKYLNPPQDTGWTIYPLIEPGKTTSTLEGKSKDTNAAIKVTDNGRIIINISHE